MLDKSSKIMKAKFGDVSKNELEIFKSLLIPYEGSVETYDEDAEMAIVKFKNEVEIKYLESLGKYTITPLESDVPKVSNQNLRKRENKFASDRCIIDEYDIMNIFLDATIFVPLICVLLSVIVIFSLF